MGLLTGSKFPFLPEICNIFRVYIPIGPKGVPFWGSYLEFYKVIRKRSYFGAYG